MAQACLSLDSSVICHAWNSDKTQIALSANSKDVLVYCKSPTTQKFELAHTLLEHTSKVLSIDWAVKSNRILTCGADKNAYVWNFDGQTWKPDLVVLRINRAATCCKWSPLENKFAVGCGLKCICVCYYEKSQQFWVSKHIRKQLKSSVLCLDWHPNNILLAAGGSDYKCRIFSTYIDNIDGVKPVSSEWGSNLSPTECLVEYGNQENGWVYSLSFSPSGRKIAWVGHDSSVYVVDADRGLNEIIATKTPFLPFLNIKFITESTLVVAGHDCIPIVYSLNGNKISLLEKLNVTQTSTASKTKGAIDKFKNLDRLNTENATTTEQNLIHQNSIKEINVLESSGKISTCGLDGIVAVWDLKALESQFSNLQIK